VLANIVNEESTYSATVVGGGDSAVAFLSRCVPDLRLDGFGVDLDAARGELDTDCRLAVEVELIAGESREQVRFSYAGVSDQDDCGVMLVRGRRPGGRGRSAPLKRNCRYR
jgi:hypothetical protein